MRFQLSDNFWLDEFTRSDVAARLGYQIVVPVDSRHYRRLHRLCETVLQPLRDLVGPIHIISGYRPYPVNRAVGGADGSQHVECLAADIRSDEFTPHELCAGIIANGYPFDQLIHEYGSWTHVSIAAEDDTPRGDVLTSYKFVPAVGKPKTMYIHDLQDVKPSLVEQRHA